MSTGLPLVSVIFLCVFGGFFGFAWVVDVAIRPICNQKQPDVGLAFRSRQKLHIPKDHAGGKQLWPLETNLCSQVVAGPGMLLHFNFQAITMVWALWGGIWWVLMALFIDSDLWTLGTRSFGKPRDNCILVAWGYEIKKRLMWIMYIPSFFFSMLHGVRQLRLFNSIDCQMKTMKDFVCMIVGLPDGIKGSDKGVEEELAQTVRSWSGTDVVGASMCWNWKAQEDDCMKALNADLKEKEDAHKAKKRAATRI